MSTEIYFIGGCIRDLLLGLTPKDFDKVVVNCDQDTMSYLISECKQVGKDFPVYIDPVGDEIACARTERSTGGKTTDFEFETDNVSLEDDALRRDLTINTLAYPAELQGDIGRFDPKKVIDPTNLGLMDLNNRVLRHTTGAFIEDPLRVLRLIKFYVRFYPQGFTVAPETIRLVATMISRGDLLYISAERIHKELLEIVSHPLGHVASRLINQIIQELPDRKIPVMHWFLKVLQEPKVYDIRHETDPELVLIMRAVRHIKVVDNKTHTFKRTVALLEDARFSKEALKYYIQNYKMSLLVPRLENLKGKRTYANFEQEFLKLEEGEINFLQFCRKLVKRDCVYNHHRLLRYYVGDDKLQELKDLINLIGTVSAEKLKELSVNEAFNSVHNITSLSRFEKKTEIEYLQNKFKAKACREIFMRLMQ